jgi:Ti-type conjugative transfer relaxase TraA
VLSIGKLTGPDSERYYTTKVAKGREDYYSGRGEAPGRWVGTGTDLLMETDREVAASDLAALLQGRSPADGERLRKRMSARSVSGFDLTFSAPKSVSVLYGIGDERVVAVARSAHDAAVDQALGYLERTACWTRRGFGGREHVHGRGFVGAAYRHRTSRAGDPGLHTHVVVANMTQQPDGTWSALDARHLYRQSKTAGYLYQAALRAQLTQQLGVRWMGVHHGAADIEGVPRRILEHFSRRRAEILDHMADRGEHSARAAEVAALDTRQGKEYDVPIDRLRADWRARAEEHGFGPAELVELLERSEPFPEREIEGLQAALTAHELTRESSTFDRRDVLRAWAELHRQGADVSTLEQVADDWLKSPSAVPLEEERRGPWERRHSTPEMLACEKELIDDSRGRRGTGAGRVEKQTVEQVLADRRELGKEQAEMVRRLATSGDGVQIVRAAAGTGKTYALDAAREAWERGGYQVRGCALSARAAVELQDQTAIPSTTLARLQIELRQGWNLTPQTVLVIDEAATVGTRDMAEVARHAKEMGAKLVLTGDDRQLPEIEAGGAFRGLAKRLRAIELREVRRQRAEWDREALAALRDGKVDRWLEAYREHGRVHGAHDAASARAQLVDHWYAAHRDHPDDDSVMIAVRRSDVAELNARARERLHRAGALGDKEIEAAGKELAEGDRVIAGRNDHRTGLANGSRGTVIEVDTKGRRLTVRLDDGRKIDVPAGYLDEGHLDHGYAMTAHRAQGTTVDRAYVLGSDELYREWGYTALSRHRDEAHFYVNVADGQLTLQLGLDEPGREEHVFDPLHRSRAKHLASDLLRDSATIPEADSIESEVPDLDGKKLDEYERALERLARSEREFADTSRLARARRAELQRRIEAQRRAVRYWQAEIERPVTRPEVPATQLRSGAELAPEPPAPAPDLTEMIDLGP